MRRFCVHMLEGWVLFLVALVLLVAFHQLVNRVYMRFHGIEEHSVAA